MTDLHQPPKKTARPNLFAPKEATRIIDERISVLASLDANPPPKKKKKRGLAGSTLVMLGITGVLFAGVIYLVLTQPAQSTDETTAAAPPLPQASSDQATAAASPSANSEAPTLSLSALAASAPGSETSAPASAIIENEATPASHNPIAILESSNSHSEKTAPAKPAANAHGSPASLLKALNAPTQDKPAVKAPTAQSIPVASPKSTTRTTRASNKPAASTRTPAPKATTIDSDVVLLEGLLASSNPQEAKDRAATKSKDKPQESAAEANREGSAAKPQ